MYKMMKKIEGTKKWILSLLMLGFTLYGCDLNDDSVMPQLDTSKEVLSSGSWVVSNYTEDNIDKTSYFSGYSLTFNDDASVKAEKNDVTVYGSWQEVVDSGKRKLVFDFEETQPFDELTDDWEIAEITAIKIKLNNVSGGDGSLSELILQKQ